MLTRKEAPVALVTGAASGMGAALTQHLVAKGWRVAMCDVNATAGEKHSAALNIDWHPSGLSSTMFRKIDITDYAHQAAFFQEAFDWSGGHIDYFAANAGIMDVGSLFQPAKTMTLDPRTNLPLPPSTAAIDVNLRAVVEGIWLYRFFHGKQQRQRGSKNRPRGRITVTVSSAGFYPFHGQVQYTASKHALIGVVRSSAVPLRGENISINGVCPSFVDTPLLPRDFARDWPKEHLVPMENVLRAHDLLIDDGRDAKWRGLIGRETTWDTQEEVARKAKKRRKGMVTGETVELSQGELFFRRQIPYPNEGARWLNEDSVQYFRGIERAKKDMLRERERASKL